MNMKKSKKLLSIILALGMLFSLLPMTALAVVPPLTVGTGGDYATLTEALGAAENGSTITLLNNITESVSYTVAIDKTITIDGDGHTVAGVAGDSSIALSLSGEGNIILKDVNLSGGLGGSTTSTASEGLHVTDSLNVISVGTVTATGGTDKYSCGLYHNGSGAVNLTTATGRKYGINNNSTGTVNVTNATGTAGIIENYGVFNNSSGTVNVTAATGSNVSGIGVVNWGTGTVNAITAAGQAFGVYNKFAGTVNALSISGATANSSGTVNTGAAVVVIALNKGADASCVLDSIAVAAAGSTTLGALPGVYKDGVSGAWYTDAAKTAMFIGTAINAGTTFYSTFCTSVSGKILDNVTGAGMAATVQLMDSSGKNVGNAVTAAADGSYIFSNVPAGTGYTISAALSGYADGIIPAFDVTDTNITSADVTLHSLIVGTGNNTLSDALASAGDGDTITLVSDIAESVFYTVTNDKAVTIDGGGNTLTGNNGTDGAALTLSGTGTIKLKNIKLQGGFYAGNYGAALLAEATATVTVAALGAVDCISGAPNGSSYPGWAVCNLGSSVVNVTSATGTTENATGVLNNAAGTINVGAVSTTSANHVAIANYGAGTVNAGSASATSGTAVFQPIGSSGTINVGSASATTGNAIFNTGSGKVNAGSVSSESVNTGTFNTGSATTTLTLQKGTGATCVLDSITVAASGDTTIGTLPSVYKNGVAGAWYTNAAKTDLFSGTTVTAATTLYSDYYEAFAVITKDSTTTYYEALTEALTAAANGDTVTLLGNITESATYTGTAGKTITIDGGGFTVTAPDSASESIALSLSGEGTVTLTNITLQGGSATNSSVGLRVDGLLDIRSDGTVSVYGGNTAGNGFGLANYSVGTVDVTTASASGSNIGFGVANYTTGTVNVSTAEGSGIQGTGVFNQSSGTVNVTTATGTLYGVLNQSTGTVNVTTATATGLGGTAVSNGSGTVNAGTITGSTVGSGTINTGTGVASVTLKAGTGASCVLDSITVAASGDTTVGTLPSVYKDGAYSNHWYTDNAKTLLYNDLTPTVTGATTLLSDYYELAQINTAAIAGVTAPVKGAAPTSSITDTTEYTATISWSPTTATFAASTVYTATITITPKIGYTLTGVAENSFTVAGAAATNAAGSGVVTAVFPATAPSGSGSDSGSSNIAITTVGSVTTGTATVTGTTSGSIQTVSVPRDTMTSLTDAAKTAEAAGKTSVAQINTGRNSGLTKVGVTIPGTPFDAFASGTNATLQITSSIGTVTFSSDAVDTIGAAGSGDVFFGMGMADRSALTADQQASVGDRPVYSFSVTVGNAAVSEFGSSVTVSLPYTLGADEDPNAIVVYCLDASGSLQTMPGAYDKATGTVTFETTHFSYYVIGYNKADFTDVDDAAWYSDAVTFLAARGITTGTTATTFSPDATLTRGQFVTLLLRAYGIGADTNPANNFSDAGNTYYTGYLAAAKELGISNGVGGNRFAPEQAITRQEMFTMLYNALKVLGKLPDGVSGKSLSDFTDSDHVAPWANEAMTVLVKAGTVSGSGGKVLPTALATRAEMAQVLYHLLAK